MLLLSVVDPRSYSKSVRVRFHRQFHGLGTPAPNVMANGKLCTFTTSITISSLCLSPSDVGARRPKNRPLPAVRAIIGTSPVETYGPPAAENDADRSRIV